MEHWQEEIFNGHWQRNKNTLLRKIANQDFILIAAILVCLAVVAVVVYWAKGE